jgi:uncharacterized protein YutE (UPF0331/DUF86 family)
MIDADVVYAKVGNIQRCLRRIKEVTALDPARLDDIDVQDIFVLNLQRAIQSAIDLAAHAVSEGGLGVPAVIKENFSLLKDAKVLDPGLADRMQRMVGFRNIAVHDYQNLDIEILKSILMDHLIDLEDFYRVILVHYQL